MSNLDLILMGLKNLFRRKARTFLTVLGVVIGTASIVVMVSLGLGLNKSFEMQLSQMGSLNVIEVNSSANYGEAVAKDQMKLDEAAVVELEKIDHVKVAMAFERANGSLFAGRYQSWADVIGVDFDKLAQFDIDVHQGVMPSKDGINEVLLGGSVLENFYDPKSRNYNGNGPEIDAFNDRFQFIPGNSYFDGRPRGVTITPTGIIDPNNWDYGYNVFIDKDQLKKAVKDYNRRHKTEDSSSKKKKKEAEEYQQVKVLVDDMKNVKVVQDQIKTMGFRTYSMTEMLDSMKETSKLMQMILGGIGAVALFVAAIGITNTMVMSIYERTKEIGVMKVIGAQLKDIKKLFLFEAAMIGLMGGILGVILSLGISHLLNSLAGGSNLMGYGGGGETILSYIPPWLALVGMAFSTLIGIISGYYPAVRATKLSALEAIRSDG